MIYLFISSSLWKFPFQISFTRALINYSLIWNCSQFSVHFILLITTICILYTTACKSCPSGFYEFLPCNATSDVVCKSKYLPLYFLILWVMINFSCEIFFLWLPKWAYTLKFNEKFLSNVWITILEASICMIFD